MTEILVKHNRQSYYVVDDRIRAKSDWTDLTDRLSSTVRNRIFGKAKEQSRKQKPERPNANG